MIPNQWYTALPSQNVKMNRPVGVRLLGRELVLWRDIDGRVICQDAACPHKGANLSDGRVIGDTISCPYHGFRFTTEGTCTTVPCLGANARIPKSLRLVNHPVRERNGLIWVWHGENRADLPEIPLPPEVTDRDDVYATATWTQPVHYTRYIESLLEFYHVPHVHRDHWFNYADYLGFGGTLKKLGLDGRRRFLAATKIENSEVTSDGVSLRNSFDLCQEGDETNRMSVFVMFTFPGLVHLSAPPFDVSVWISPIDDENTRVIFRWYEDRRLRRYVGSEHARRLIPRMALFMQKRVQEVQDMNIVKRIEPRISERGVSKFVAADELNARYLAMRAKLIEEARSASATANPEASAAANAANVNTTANGTASTVVNSTADAAANGSDAPRRNGARRTKNGAAPAVPAAPVAPAAPAAQEARTVPTAATAPAASAAPAAAAAAKSQAQSQANGLGLTEGDRFAVRA